MVDFFFLRFYGCIYSFDCELMIVFIHVVKLFPDLACCKAYSSAQPWIICGQGSKVDKVKPTERESERERKRESWAHGHVRL